MYMEQMQPALRAYLTKLREDAYIDIKPGFVDSGASPKETKPVFTSYAAPVVKPKKVSEKKRYESATGRFSQAAAVPEKQVVASPDTTGGRTITGPDAKPLIDPATGLAVIAAPAPKAKAAVYVTTKHGKRKIHKEKVRFGQAPRNALPASPDSGSAGSTGATPGGIGPAVAPGAILADTASAPESSSQVNAAEDPLAPKAPERKKTRYADREVEVKAAKVKKVEAKEVEKAKATPTPITTDEKLAQQTQAAPLGLNGDTAKHKKVKTKKVKRKKGDPKPEKERIQEKTKAVPVAPAPVAPTVNPALAPGAPATATPASTAPVPPPAEE
jgi:peptidyl-prolyl cis-trans isomerase SurA